MYLNDLRVYKLATQLEIDLSKTLNQVKFAWKNNQAKQITNREGFIA